MKFLKVFSIILAAGLCFGTVTKADEASKRALVMELLEPMNLNEVYDQMRQNTFKQMKSVYTKQFPTLSEKTINILSEEIYKGFEPLYPAVIASYTESYLSHFTEPELQELVNMQNSPIGQKHVQLMPVLMQTAGEVANNFVTNKIPAIITNIKKRIVSEGIK